MVMITVMHTLKKFGEGISIKRYRRYKKTRMKLLKLLDGTTRCGMKSTLSGADSRLGITEDIGLRAFL